MFVLLRCVCVVWHARDFGRCNGNIHRPVGHAVVTEILDQFGGGIAHIDCIRCTQIIRFQHVSNLFGHHLIPATYAVSE